MTGHLTEDAVLRMLDGMADPSDRAHAGACEACAARVREVEEGLALAREGSEVPEPSPLYWDSFRRQVGQRIAEEPASPARWRRFFRLGALLPAAAAAALLLGVIPWREVQAPAPDSAKVLPAWEALPSGAEDAGLVVLEGLALDGSDLEAAAGCRGVVDCLVALSDEESQDVALELQSVLRVRS
jgi:hypothetical protein